MSRYGTDEIRRLDLTSLISEQSRSIREMQKKCERMLSLNEHQKRQGITALINGKIKLELMWIKSFNINFIQNHFYPLF